MYLMKLPMFDGKSSSHRAYSTSKYMPHNGKQEMARRLRQMASRRKTP